MRHILFVFPLVLSAALGACAPESQPDVRVVRSCVADGPDGGVYGCIEINAYGESHCTSGRMVEAPCDRTGSVGSCQDPYAQAGTLTTVYFPPFTVDVARQGCTAIGGTFIEP